MNYQAVNRCLYSYWMMFGFICLLQCTVLAGPLVEWDFTKGAQGWAGNQQVKPVEVSGEGLVVQSTGIDPWIEGPAVDIAPGSMVRLTLRLKTNADGSARYFMAPPSVLNGCANVILFTDNQWHDYEVMIGDGMGPKTRFRLDPCNDIGLTVVQFIRVEAVNRPQPPVWDKPQRFSLDGAAASSRSEGVQVRCGQECWGAMSVWVDGREMASGYSGELISVLYGDKTEHLQLNNSRAVVKQDGSAVESTVLVSDGGGAQWRLSRRFVPVSGQSALEVVVTVAVDQERDVTGVPWLTLLPGLGTFATHKHQALFAGLEYLDDEPSSSTADITVADHVRRIPDPVNITFPLMAIEQDGRYVGLIWEKSPWVAAGFDSPDTVFGSGAQAMWLSGPNVGPLRFANDMVAHSPMHFKANQPVTVRAWIIGGKAASMAPVVQQFVQLRGLPAVPEFAGGYPRAVELLAHGWLDSAANRGFLFRHAVWGDNFGPSPAADAAMYMQWLARAGSDKELAGRLRSGVDETLKKLNPGDPFDSAVSHVRLLTPTLVFGRVEEFVQLRQRQAWEHLKRFDEQGRVIYRAGAGEVDYGKTHFANHANGMGALYLVNILEAATLCGDAELNRAALALLDKQTTLYANTVPRGAQTWEVPLHTPDILASAHLIRAYVYGYLLNGKPEYLEQARYWAWTGVPFVYLVNPADGPVGPYATIAVLGATNWIAPVWFGQPVQWCGLVYGSALHLLADYDETGPWRQIARGITITGLQIDLAGERQGAAGVAAGLLSFARAGQRRPGDQSGNGGGAHAGGFWPDAVVCHKEAQNPAVAAACPVCHRRHQRIDQSDNLYPGRHSRCTLSSAGGRINRCAAER